MARLTNIPRKPTGRLVKRGALIVSPARTVPKQPKERDPGFNIDEGNETLPAGPG